jgi:wyosine [tRNA(Phe)-imidazoG37] synthetase (radical SAM superfamily)
MSEPRKYIFGPVPSRRLGLSLGVDIVPFKTCTQNCVYCQLGRNALTTRERKAYVPIGDVLAEIKDAIRLGLKADHITISGSGEPTLNSDLGRLIDGIRALTSIPVAIITNGTMLGDAAVRADCAKADVVLPSLDAGDEATFQVINKPHESISLQNLVDGISSFRSEYKGRIWLEVFIVEGDNTSDDQIRRMRQLIDCINPDRVHLNTAVRPTAERGVMAATPARLAEIARALGSKAEVIADFDTGSAGNATASTQDILAMLKRRPCSVDDICKSMGISTAEAERCLKLLMTEGVVEMETRNSTAFYIAK